jgi:hypothetical protein
MSTVFSDEASVFFVGGITTKVGDSKCGGCAKQWFDDNFTQLSDIMAADGGPKWEFSGISYDHRDGGHGDGDYKFLDQENGEFAGVEVGMVAYIEDGGAGGIMTGRYKINYVDPSGDFILVDSIIATGDSSNIILNIGGAFGKLQEAVDECSGYSYSCDIYDNVDEEYMSTSDQIDIDSGGSIARNTHLRIIGFNTTPGDMDYGGAFYQSAVDCLVNGITTGDDATKCCVMKDAGNQACSVLNFNNVDNVELRNLYLYRTFGGAGQYAVKPTNDPTALSFINCRFDNVDKVLGGTIDNVLLVGCFSGTDIGRQAYTAKVGGTFIGNVMQGPAANILVGSAPGCSMVFINNILIGCWHGFRNYGCVTAINNTFYNQSISCATTANTAAETIMVNNIFMPQAGAYGLYIQSGGGSVQYNDYNCYCDVNGDGLSTPIVSDYSGGTVPAMGKHCLEVDPKFVDAANGRFRPLNPLVLRGGRPGLEDNAAAMGAILYEYQFAARGRMANLGRLGIMK